MILRLDEIVTLSCEVAKARPGPDIFVRRLPLHSFFF